MSCSTFQETVAELLAPSPAGVAACDHAGGQITDRSNSEHQNFSSILILKTGRGSCRCRWLSCAPRALPFQAVAIQESELGLVGATVNFHRRLSLWEIQTAEITAENLLPANPLCIAALVRF